MDTGNRLNASSKANAFSFSNKKSHMMLSLLILLHEVLILVDYTTETGGYVVQYNPEQDTDQNNQQFPLPLCFPAFLHLHIRCDHGKSIYVPVAIALYRNLSTWHFLKSRLEKDVHP